ncbi:MAG: hypothetical protein QXG00_06850 [Candidatus Woesearchaeota archaeon]
MTEQNKDIIEEAKKHPTLRILGGIFTFVAAVISGFITIDERYAHAGDISKLETSQKQQILYLKDENEKAILEMRKRAIEDKIFELNLKEKQSQIDKALIKRYEAESKNIDEKVNQLEQINKTRALQILK